MLEPFCLCRLSGRKGVQFTEIAEPLPVTSTFDFRDENGRSLSDVARLDTMVTVVDAANLLKDYSSFDFLADRGETAGDGDNRTLVDLLVEQIEFADVVILNKIGTASPEQRDAARKIIASLNADAKLIEADFGKVKGSAEYRTFRLRQSGNPSSLVQGTAWLCRPCSGIGGIRYPVLCLSR